MSTAEKILEQIQLMLAQNANQFNQISGMLHAQNAMLSATMQALPNRPDLIANLHLAHTATIKTLKDSNQSSAQTEAVDSMFSAALNSLTPGGKSDKERIQEIVDQIAANRNGILVLMNLIASQPSIDPSILIDELNEASSVQNVLLNLPTVPLLEEMLEITIRRNPGS